MIVFVNYIGDAEKCDQTMRFLRDLAPSSTFIPSQQWMTMTETRRVASLIAAQQELRPLLNLICDSFVTYKAALELKRLLHRNITVDMVVTCTDTSVLRIRCLHDASRPSDFYTDVKELSALRVATDLYFASTVTFLQLSHFWQLAPYISKKDHIIWEQNLVTEEVLPEFMWGKWLIMNSIEPRQGLFV